MDTQSVQPVTLDFSAVADALGRLNDAGLVASGGVAVVSLGCVREAMADRWASKREQVWDHAERTLTRALGPASIVTRAGDEDFLVAQPGVERATGLGQALQAMKEILQFFLGEVRPADLRLRQVEAVQGGEVICREVAPGAMPADPDIVAVERKPVAAAKRPAPPRRVFAAVDGAAIRVVCALDKVMALRSGALSAYRLRPAVADISGPTPVPVRLAALDWRDAERVDLAILEQAPDVVAGLNAPLVVAPASFSTLSAQRGRRLVLEHVDALALRLGRPVAVEIRDLRGVPASRLAEVVSQVKRACQGVLGEVEPDRADISAIAGCGLSGLSVRPRRDWTADAQQIEQFSGLGALARQVAPIALTRAFTHANLALLAATGFTHATIGAEQGAPDA